MWSQNLKNKVSAIRCWPWVSFACYTCVTDYPKIKIFYRKIFFQKYVEISNIQSSCKTPKPKIPAKGMTQYQERRVAKKTMQRMDIYYPAIIFLKSVRYQNRSTKINHRYSQRPFVT